MVTGCCDGDVWPNVGVVSSSSGAYSGALVWWVVGPRALLYGATGWSSSGSYLMEPCGIVRWLKVRGGTGA